MNRWEKRNPNTGKIRMRTTNRPEIPKNSWKIGSRWHGSEGDKGNPFSRNWGSTGLSGGTEGALSPEPMKAKIRWANAQPLCDALKESQISSLCQESSLKKQRSGASLVVQWGRIHLPTRETQVRALIQEDSICRGAAGPACHSS